jgi:hypothetical protein
LKEEWRELAAGDPEAAALRKRHLGAPGSLGLESLSERIGAATEWVAGERRAFYRAVSRLLGVNYPLR